MRSWSILGVFFVALWSRPLNSCWLRASSRLKNSPHSIMHSGVWRGDREIVVLMNYTSRIRTCWQVLAVKWLYLAIDKYSLNLICALKYVYRSCITYHIDQKNCGETTLEMSYLSLDNFQLLDRLSNDVNFWFNMHKFVYIC